MRTRLVLKNLGTDIRPEYAILTIDGEKVTNLIDIQLQANENGNTATIVIDLDPPSRDDDEEDEGEPPVRLGPHPGGDHEPAHRFREWGKYLPPFGPLPFPDEQPDHAAIGGRNCRAASPTINL